MNESHLDPDIHLWPECPDDVCFHCGYKFPADAEIDEGSPMYEGFCSQECMTDHENKKPISCIRPMHDFLCGELYRDTPEGWDRSVYKGTDCGAWLKLNGSDMVALGSIVEGSDVEIGPVYLSWPFSLEDFWGALENIEKEAEFYWHRDNDDQEDY